MLYAYSVIVFVYHCQNAPYFPVLHAPSAMSILWYTAHLDIKRLKSLFVVLSLQSKTCQNKIPEDRSQML